MIFWIPWIFTFWISRGKNTTVFHFFHISVDSSKQSKSLLSHLLTSINCVSPSCSHHFPIIFPTFLQSDHVSSVRRQWPLRRDGRPPPDLEAMAMPFGGWKRWKKWEKRWKKWDKPEEFLEHLVKLWVKSGKHVIRKNEGKDVGTYGNMLGTNWMIIGWSIYWNMSGNMRVTCHYPHACTYW